MKSDPASIPIEQLKAAAGIAAPVSVLLAFAYFMGWRRTQSLYSEFGIDSSLLGFSQIEYLLRSVDVMLLLLPPGLLGFFGVSLSLGFLTKRLGNHSLRYLGWIVLLGILMVGAAAVHDFAIHGAFFVTAFSSVVFTVGAFLAWYASTIRRRVDRHQERDEQSHEDGPLTLMARLVLAGVLLTSLFSVGSHVASWAGAVQAERLTNRADQLPTVVLHTDTPLQLPACPAPAAVSENPQPYCYGPLKFLVRTGGSYFVFPAGMSPREGIAVVDEKVVQATFAPGG